MTRPLLWMRSALTAFMIAGVRSYQALLRPILPTVCRFHPSCSEYFILAVQQYGPLKGARKGLWRVCRCNPWSPGGYDPP
jgi:uncharacterized protein